MSPAIRHIVWDWNGTLLHDTSVIVAAANAALTALDLPADMTVPRWRDVAERPVRRTYEFLAGRPLTEPEWQVVEDVWIEAYDVGFPAARLGDETLAALDEVDRLGWTQSIVSLHTVAQLREQVAAHGLMGRFIETVGADPKLWAGGENNKGTLMAAHLQARGIDPAATGVIGDMADDADAAIYCGATPVLVATGDCSRARLEASGYPVTDGVLSALSYLARHGQVS